jgi:hypothetical protein
MKNSPTGSGQAAQCDIGVRGALLLLINTYSILYEVILSCNSKKIEHNAEMTYGN